MRRRFIARLWLPGDPRARHGSVRLFAEEEASMKTKVKGGRGRRALQVTGGVVVSKRGNQLLARNFSRYPPKEGGYGPGMNGILSSPMVKRTFFQELKGREGHGVMKLVSYSNNAEEVDPSRDNKKNQRGKGAAGIRQAGSELLVTGE